MFKFYIKITGTTDTSTVELLNSFRHFSLQLFDFHKAIKEIVVSLSQIKELMM